LGIGPNPQSPIPNPQSPIPQSPIPNYYKSINLYLKIIKNNINLFYLLKKYKK